MTEEDAIRHAKQHLGWSEKCRLSGNWVMFRSYIATAKDFLKYIPESRRFISLACE